MYSFKKLLDIKKNYKNLGEIATEIYKGNGITKEQLGTGDYPCTTYGSISNAFFIWFDKCNFTVNPSLIKNPKFFEYGDLLMVAVSQSMRCVGNCCAYLGNEKGIAGVALFVIKHNQSPKYLAYALSTHEVKKQKQILTNVGVVNNINTNGVKKLKIPLPPLEIQEKIASFLDLLRSDLERVKKELGERRKQYSFYKNKLIEGVSGKLKSLDEIATEIIGGNNICKTDTSRTGYPCVLYKDINRNDDLFIYKCSCFVDPNLIKNPKFCSEGDVLITNSCRVKGKSCIGKVCVYLGKETFMPGGVMFVVKHQQNPKYMVYALSTRNVQIQNKINSKFDSWSRRIGLDDVKKIKIPLPPIEIQEEIANKIDKFRRLCIEILPRELELVRKRYEYYRELLIN